MSRRFFRPAPRLRGTVVAPADKSLSHRAALFAAMASEPVRVTNFLPAEDTLSTLRAVQALGVLVQEREDGLILRGPGLRAAEDPGHVIDVGNAGTLIRLISGWLAGQRGGGRWALDGDESIRRPPMGRVVEPLRLVGGPLQAEGPRERAAAAEGRPHRGVRVQPRAAHDRRPRPDGDHVPDADRVGPG